YPVKRGVVVSHRDCDGKLPHTPVAQSLWDGPEVHAHAPDKHQQETVRSKLVLIAEKLFQKIKHSYLNPAPRPGIIRMKSKRRSYFGVGAIMGRVHPGSPT